MIVSLLGTFVIYLTSIILFRSVLDLDFILEENNWAYVLTLTVISWIPFYIFKKIKKCVSPDQLQQLRRYHDTGNYVNINDDYGDSKSKKLLS